MAGRATRSRAATSSTSAEAHEPEKAWLYREHRARALPDRYEGFGFIPYEAAEAGSPALWAAQSSMADLLPAELAGIVPWDVDASAATRRG